MIKKLIKKILKAKGYEIYRSHFYDFNDLNALGKVFSRDSRITIFDVGANVGQTVKRFKEYWPNAIIYSFEPSPEVYLKLKENTKHYTDVHVFNVGLGDKEEEKIFHKMVDSGSSSFIPINKTSKTYNILNSRENLKHHNKTTLKSNEDRTEKCKITTIDKFCADHGIDHIDLLKIDVQGYEPYVLQGAEQMLASNKISTILTEIMFTDIYSERRSFADIENIVMKHKYLLHDIPYLARVPTTESQRVFFVDAIYSLPKYCQQ